MSDKDYVDYYEVLESSPNASTETLERVFRYLAKRYHPDCAERGDVKKFSLLVEAQETLTDPVARAEFDVEHQKQNQQTAALVEETAHLSSDNADRHKLLSLFYAQRRRSMKQPGIGVGTLEHVMGLPEEVLGFHIWFFQEKGWIAREESGLFSITADGVEKIEATTQSTEESRLKRITQQDDKVGYTGGAAAMPQTAQPAAV